MFETEITTLIKNQEIRDIVTNALASCFKDVWEKPASSTMKYHPLNEDGGIETVLQHTKRVVLMASMLLENECFMEGSTLTDDDKDILIASAILHDSCKYGLEAPASEKYTKFEHPILVGKLLPSDNGGYWDRIVEVVSSHSGFWNTNKYSEVTLPTPKTRLQILLHQADWLASRKNVQVYSTCKRSLFARLREAVIGWWNERKLGKCKGRKA